MQVWVTGGAGFIGSHVADDLLDAGHRVIVIDDLSTGRRENVPAGATFLELDIRDGKKLEAAFDAHPPDVITHQAAQTSVAVSTREPIRDAEINVIGAVRLLELARQRNVHRLVFASTGGALYGEVPDGTTATEDTHPEPISPYACSKLAFEGYLGAYRREHGFVSTILRYANVYGPRQDPHGEAGVVAIFSEHIGRGNAVRINARRELGDDGCVRDYVYVRDVVHANRLAVNGELEETVVNVGTGIGTTTRTLATVIEGALGTEVDKHDAPRRDGDIERSVLRPNPALGARFEPIGLSEGIAETIAWLRARG